MKRFAFTKKAIEALPVHDPDSPSREAEYSDVECVGLKLRVSKNGRRFFQHRYMLQGRKRCLSIGEFPYVSVQEARHRVGEHKALLSRRIDPADQRQKKNDISLRVFALEYYLPHAMSHKRSWKNDEYMIHRILPLLGHLSLSHISHRDISLFHNKEKERNSATSANHYLILLKRMFNLAIKWDLLEKNPTDNLEKFRLPPQRERYLSKEELPRFLNALEEMDDRLSMAAIKLLLFTGCRKTEILSLQWQQVKLEESRLHLPMTKNGQSRSVVLNTKAKEALHRLREDRQGKRTSTYLFPSREGTRKGHLNDLRKPFMKVCAAAKIDGLRIHDLRHSFASFAVMSGASLYDVSKLLGHSDTKMTQRYAHLSDDCLQKASDQVSRVIEEAVGQ